MKRVLVTGGAGFIGSNLCRKLLQSPGVQEVRVIDDFSTSTSDSLSNLNVELDEASILDANALSRAAKGCDAVVHLAALGSVPRSISDPIGSHAANATGTLMVLEAARANNNAHVILASSSSVYGANPTLPKREDMLCMPMSPYAVSKLATEQYAMAYAQCYNLPVLPFRFFNVFGPGQLPGHAYAAVIPVLLEAAIRGRELPINGDGEHSRDFTYVGTVVEAIVQAITKQTTGGPTNLAFGTRTTLNELVRLIGELMTTDIKVLHRPERPGDVRHSQADNGLLRAAFPGLQPVDLRAGLGETLQWMRCHLSATGSTACEGS